MTDSTFEAFRKAEALMAQRRPLELQAQANIDGGGFYLERPGMDKLHRWYLPDPALDDAPLASVLLRTEFPSGLAPAFVATAGFDPLRDEGEAYARRLAEHGVEVTVQRYPAMIHGFFNIVGVGRECRANAADIAGRLRKGLG